MSGTANVSFSGSAASVGKLQRVGPSMPQPKLILFLNVDAFRKRTKLTTARSLPIVATSDIALHCWLFWTRPADARSNAHASAVIHWRLGFNIQNTTKKFPQHFTISFGEFSRYKVKLRGS
ncbi:hypothetical protein BaRGS_00035254 [Batillaria attramentaria]|uniref:Uncharacterized protein n=1 Tax=Batillaria attramentaria TaxID=370345 RepID=A0ABD0JF14_9CAEN